MFLLHAFHFLCFQQSELILLESVHLAQLSSLSLKCVCYLVYERDHMNYFLPFLLTVLGFSCRDFFTLYLEMLNPKLFLIQTHSLAFSSIFVSINFSSVHMCTYIHRSGYTYICMEACVSMCIMHFPIFWMSSTHTQPILLHHWDWHRHSEQRADSLLPTHDPVFFSVLDLFSCCSLYYINLSRPTALKQGWPLFTS